MTENEMITLIIPVYNAQDYLKKCLDSIIHQSFENLEILCIDDGSTDGSLQLLENYKREDQRIIILIQNNKGAGPARNLGIQKANGSYLFFIDADDWFPDKFVLEELYKAARKNRTDICGGSICYLNENGIVKDKSNQHHFIKEGWMDFSDFQWDYGFYRYLYRRDFLIENKITFPDLRRYQDPPFLLNAMIKAKKFYAITKEVYCFRIKKENFENWNFVKVNDLIKGILLCINIAKENNLNQVMKNNLKRINKDFSYAFVSSVKQGNTELKGFLDEADLLAKEIMNDKSYTIMPLRILSGEKTAIVQDLFGRTIESLKEHGLRYTIHRILTFTGLK